MFDETIKCFRAPCGQTFSNGCAACRNPSVAYYVPGKCDSLQSVQAQTSESVKGSTNATLSAATSDSAADNFCPKRRSIMCTMIYSPVCAFYDESVNCAQKPCVKNFGSGCSACADAKIIKHRAGVCSSMGLTAMAD